MHSNSMVLKGAKLAEVPVEENFAYTFVKTSQGLYVKDDLKSHITYYIKNLRLTFTAGKDLMIDTQVQNPFAEANWAYEASPKACLPFSSGLSNLSWHNEGKVLVSQLGARILKARITGDTLGSISGEGKPRNCSWSFSDHTDVGEGVKVAKVVKFDADPPLYVHRTYNIDDLKFLKPSDPLPPFPWDSLKSIGDNRTEPGYSISIEKFKKHNGGKLPNDVDNFIAIVNLIRPKAQEEMRKALEAGARMQKAKASSSSSSSQYIFLIAVAAVAFVLYQVFTTRKKS